MTATLQKTRRKKPTDLIEVTADRKLRLHLHKGQRKLWNSTARFNAAIAGSQSGKTVLGPPWLHREIQRCGPGDYLVVSPSYKLLAKKALPAFRRYFEDLLQLGTYHAGAAEFRFSEEGMRRMFGEPKEGEVHEPTTVFFGHAQDPESLESVTAKAAWLDEARQKGFKLESWEAILRRLSLFMGRILITTTPYNLGWLKQKVWDKWKAGDPDYLVVNFPSTQNPLFSKEEAARAKRDLPYWKYAMFYLGLFTRPAGLIYDSFDEKKNKVRTGHTPGARSSCSRTSLATWRRSSRTLGNSMRMVSPPRRSRTSRAFTTWTRGGTSSRTYVVIMDRLWRWCKGDRGPTH